MVFWECFIPLRLVQLTIYLYRLTNVLAAALDKALNSVYFLSSNRKEKISIPSKESRISKSRISLIHFDSILVSKLSLECGGTGVSVLALYANSILSVIGECSATSK